MASPGTMLASPLPCFAQSSTHPDVLARVVSPMQLASAKLPVKVRVLGMISAGRDVACTGSKISERKW